MLFPFLTDRCHCFYHYLKLKIQRKIICLCLYLFYSHTFFFIYFNFYFEEAVPPLPTRRSIHCCALDKNSLPFSFCQAHAVLAKVGYPEFILNDTYINEDIKRVSVCLFVCLCMHVHKSVWPVCFFSFAVVIFRERLLWECDADSAFLCAVGHCLAAQDCPANRVSSQSKQTHYL